MSSPEVGLLVIAAIAVISPLIAELPLGFRLPAVVVEIVLGIVLGPHLLGFLAPGEVLNALSRVGLTFLFFQAGMELDFSKLKGRPMSLAARGWALSLAIATVVVALLWTLNLVRAPLLVVLALSTTTLGMLMPILSDGGEAETTFGRFAMAVGAAGEFLPILVMSAVLTTQYSHWAQIGLTALFIGIAVGACVAGLRVRPPRVVKFLARSLDAVSEFPVRVSILILTAMVALATTFGLDMVLGAFTGGLVVGLAAQGSEMGKTIRHKIQGLGSGFLIPIFFVMTGVEFDLAALLANARTLLLVPLFLLSFLVVRGTPTLLYRRDLPRTDLLPLALFSSTCLPLVVAITTVGVKTGRMASATAAALVGAALLSVLVFPALMSVLRGQVRPTGHAAAR